jgi:hypothetical protein
VQSAVALRQSIQTSRMSAMNVTTTWACHSSVIRESKLSHLPLLKPQPKTRLHLRSSGICAKREFAWERDRTRYTQHGPIAEGSSPVGSREAGVQSSLGQWSGTEPSSQSSLRPWADKAFGRRCVLQPRILVRSDVLTQKVQHPLDLWCQSVRATVQSYKGYRRRGPIR